VIVKVRVRPENGRLYFDFTYRGHRCREQTLLSDTAPNRKRMTALAKRMSAEIELGSFDYVAYFPEGSRAAQFSTESVNESEREQRTPAFSVFVEAWWARHKVSLRLSTQELYRGYIDKHLAPHFGSMCLRDISKSTVLDFRAELASRAIRKDGTTLSAKSINSVMGVLKLILEAASEEFGLANPTRAIKRLKQRRPDIQPFTLEEVQQIVDTVRGDYRNYLVVRFFTGLRTGEVNGLKWEHVDFEGKRLLIRESFSKGRTEGLKTDGSMRDVDMSSVVQSALAAQRELTGEGGYVFCAPGGGPIDAHNFTQRVWDPLLRYLAIKRRRPYECRHTAATLWLAAGENPEWIARQLGHTSTEMLFRVYSRYVPNLTRNDGSAMDRMLRSRIAIYDQRNSRKGERS
jgi:integrase